MARINKYESVNLAFTAATQIHERAVNLRNSSGPIPFRDLQGQLDAMRAYYLSYIQVLLSLGNAAQINPVILDFFTASSPGLPANPYTQFQAIGTALLAFYTAYDVVFDTIEPIDFAPDTGHVYADIPLAQLATLADELDAVIAAAVPLL